MGVIFHKNKKYGGTGVKVQSDPAATSLNALDVPNGQTMTSYLNSNFAKKEWSYIAQCTQPSVYTPVNISSYKELLIIMLDSSGATVCSSVYPASLAVSGSTLNVYFYYQALQFVRLVDGNSLRIGNASYPCKLYGR